MKAPVTERLTRDDAIAALNALPTDARISVLPLAPTDAIVLECGKPLTTQQADNIRASMEGLFPGHKVIVVLDGLRVKVAKAEG